MKCSHQLSVGLEGKCIKTWEVCGEQRYKTVILKNRNWSFLGITCTSDVCDHVYKMKLFRLMMWFLFLNGSPRLPPSWFILLEICPCYKYSQRTNPCLDSLCCMIVSYLLISALIFFSYFYLLYSLVILCHLTYILRFSSVTLFCFLI